MVDRHGRRRAPADRRQERPHNLPTKAVYSWEPTSLLGIYRVDEFYWNKAAGKEARCAPAQ